PISVLRLDELDPYVTGNKGFKLKHNLLRLQLHDRTRLLTFGGAYSNHLVAVA
ncbi:MAG TPA: 1-aminocyclopropane-1-carboxylate deaminase, partial [Gammaproteobacteria bacterium]|nr:1-aminocyclopropane-1-carboxylate deaminase [Gammaproteobacteria bacterium]